MSEKHEATYHGADDARAEAERRWPLPSREWLAAHEGTWTLGRFEAEVLNTGNRDGFVAGAEWQASRPPVVADDALALLRGEVEQAEADMDARWSVRGSALRDAFRRAVHIVEHAQPAAPVVADVDAIARVLGEHVSTATLFCGGCPQWIPSREQLGDWDTEGIRLHQAERVAALLAVPRV